MPIPSQTLAFLRAAAIYLAAMTLFRAVFLASHLPLFAHSGALPILGAFVTGLRFDAHVTALLLVPFFLILHIPGAWKWRRWISLPLLWGAGAGLLLSWLVFLVDLNYFDDAGKRLSYEIFTFATDAGSNLSMGLHYRWSLAAFLAGAVILGLLWKRIVVRPLGPARGPGREALFLLLFLLLSAAALRGSAGGRPLSTLHAFSWGSHEIGQLALNGMFTVEKTLASGEVRVPRLLSPAEATAALRSRAEAPGTEFLDPRYPLWRREKGAGAGKRPNVVIILLEGWADRFTGATGGKRYAATPEFDLLAGDGLLFREFYAVGRRSADGIVAACVGVPSFEDIHLFSVSKGKSGAFEQDRIAALPSILGKSGYSSLFLQGGFHESFGLDSFARKMGFARYLGLEDLKVRDDEWDHTWGVWDGVAAERFAEKLGELPRPFFGMWFTVSSHGPFKVPDPRFKTTPEGIPERDRIDSIRYADWSVGRFFGMARKEPWFGDTIFLLTADHTAGGDLPTLRDRHRTPFLIYAPGIVTPGVSDKVGSQLDMVPTILDLAGVPGPHHAFGRSLLAPGPGSAFLNAGGSYGWVESGVLLTVDGMGGNLRAEDPLTGLPSPSPPSALPLRATIQRGMELIRDNRLAPP